MTTRPKAIECERCGAGVPVMTRGPVPRFCATCRKRGRNGGGYQPVGPWDDSAEAQARALRSLSYDATGNGSHPNLNPMGRDVVLDAPLAINERSYEFHHRKNRVKRVAFTILWIVVVLLILVLMFIGWRPASFEGSALFLF